MNTISITEMQIIALWGSSNTVNGCVFLMGVLNGMAEEALKASSIYDLETIMAAKELVHTKGNIILANELH